MEGKTKEYREPRKKSFEIDYSIAESVSKYLDDNQIASWFRAIVKYECYGEISENISDQMVLMQVEQTMAILDGKMQKYIEVCDRNKANRNKGLTKKQQEERIATLKNMGLDPMDYST